MLQVYNDHYKSREAKTLENKHFREFMENKYLDLIDQRKRAWESKRKRALRKESKRTGFKNLSYMMKLKHIDRWLIKNDFDIEGTELQMIIKGNPEFELDELKQEIMKHLATTDFSFYEKFADSTDPDIRQGLREFERDIINQELGYIYAPPTKRKLELREKTLKELKEICKKDRRMYSGYSTYYSKERLINFMIRSEKEFGYNISSFIPKTITQAIEKSKYLSKQYTMFELGRLCIKKNLPDYKKKRTKRQLLNYIIEEEMARQELLIKPKALTWKREKRPEPIYQPYQIKRYESTMTKEIPDNIISSMKKLANNPREYSIGIDFERQLKQPQRMVVVQGGQSTTIKFPDFEMFGHTHPNSEYPIPSSGDLICLKPLMPEFIIAGKSGRTIILNIEDPKKYNKWLENRGQKDTSASPIDSSKLKKKFGIVDYSFKYKYGSALLKDKKGREIFFKETGVRAYPYKKGSVVEMKDDPHLEKRVPTVPSSYSHLYYSPKGWEKILRKQRVVRKRVYKKQSNLDKQLQINTKILEEYGDLKTFDRKQKRLVRSPKTDEWDEWPKWVKMKPMELRRHLNSLTVEELKQKSNLSKIQGYKRKSKIIEVLTREIEYLKALSQFGK